MLRSASVSRFRASPLAGVFSGAEGIVSPLQLPGAEAWYDVSDLSSMRNDAGAIPSNGEGVKLISDKSGNSSVNVLCLNGVAGNYASAPDSAALSITGDIDIRVNLQLVDWTPASINYVVSKWVTAGNQKSYTFGVLTTGGLELVWSSDGTTAISKVSTATVSFTDLASGWIRATLDVNDGSGNNVVKFYTSTDGTNWVQLGATVTTPGATSIFDNAQVLNIGRFGDNSNYVTGLIYRAQIRNNILDDGTGIVFDANFATAAKLAPSFTESSSNAATVTINTSGATGARISGARDLYQGTAANQPILTIAAGGNYLTFDGSNDYLKAAAFALSQPETVYFAGSQVSWVSGDAFFDGNALGNGMAVAQNSLTPALSLFAGTQISDLIAPALNTRSVISAVFSGASSFLRLNRNTAASASVGVESGNGFTLGCVRNTTGFANITASEVLVYSTAQNTAQQDAVILYEGRKWGLSV